MVCANKKANNVVKNTEGKIEKERKSLDNQHQDSLIASSREYRRRQIAFNKGKRKIQAMLSNKKEKHFTQHLPIHRHARNIFPTQNFHISIEINI